jgi:uncharacterized protein
MLIGVISDTHGLLRPEALMALKGSALIIHAGDVGSPLILEQLRGIGPVVAVRGNIDREPWAAELPPSRLLMANGHKIFVLHDLSHFAADSAPADLAAVVFGHSHKPTIGERNGIIYLNPGSAGPRRFRLPITLARLHATRTSLRPEIIALKTCH